MKKRPAVSLLELSDILSQRNTQRQDEASCVVRGVKNWAANTKISSSALLTAWAQFLPWGTARGGLSVTQPAVRFVLSAQCFLKAAVPSVFQRHSLLQL